MCGLVACLCVTSLTAPVVGATAVERLLQAHGWGTPARDADLDAAAARLAEQLDGPPGAPPVLDAAGQLESVLFAQGVSDAQVFPFTVRHRDTAGFFERLPDLLARLERRLPPTHFGLATYAGRTTTLLLVHRGVELEVPLPSMAVPGDIIPVRGALRRGYFRPRIVVAPPGRTPPRERPAWGDGRRVDVSLYFDDGPGIYGVEIIAESQYGPVVLNNHAVHVGEAGPPLPVVRAVSPPAWADPARGLVVLINAQRERRGASPLRWHDGLAAVAAEYARDLAARRSLAHASPDTGTLATRLRTHGLHFDRVAENLAEAKDAAEALRAFLASPAHARNLLDPRLTDVGVGVDGRYFAVAFAHVSR